MEENLMSFFDNSFMANELKDCVIMDKTTRPDGYGGIQTIWAEGAQFKAAIIQDSSTEASIAMAESLNDRFLVTTPKSVVLAYLDVFKTVSDGRIYQCITNGSDKASPKISTLDMRQVKVKELPELP
jgi:hypothetical protein